MYAGGFAVLHFFIFFRFPLHYNSRRAPLPSRWDCREIRCACQQFSMCECVCVLIVANDEKKSGKNRLVKKRAKQIVEKTTKLK